MEEAFDCIIIGGGLGGLTAGATLAKYGSKVLLLEQHYIPGGCATTFKRRDYVMEVGLHEIDGLHEQDSKRAIFDFLGVDQHVRFLQAPELFRFKSQTTDIVHPHGKQQTAEALIARYPDEEQGIRRYLNTMDAVLCEISRFPTARWKQRLMYPILPLLYPNIVNVSKTSLGDFLDKHISDDELKLVLQGNLAYYHDDPYTMSMVYFSAAQASYIGGGGHFVQGGSQQFSNYLASVIEDNGGQLVTGKKVTRILIEKNRACGVSFTDSFNPQLGETTLRSARVIANAAIPLVVDMLPAAQAKKLGRRIKTYDSACSLISLYIGFNTAPSDLGCQHYSTMLVGDDVQSMADIKANFHADWSQRSLIFVDYSQLDSQLAPEGKAVGVICAVDYLADWENLNDQEYADKKETVAQILIGRLEQLIPGISAHIEHYELGTPRTIQSYLLTPDGTPYGYAQTPAQSGMGRIPTKSPIRNLSFAGAWSFPGGGFTGAIISGYLCGEQVYRSLATSSPVKPARFEDARWVRLLQKKAIAFDTLELEFERPAHFDYAAGQYVVLELDQPNFTYLDMPIRTLSLASHPDEKVVRIAMRISDSRFKQRVQALQIGERCRLFGPMGDFSVSAGARGIVFLVSGIGITPVLPLLKELDKQRFSEPVFLFYSNRTERAAAYHQQLQKIDLPSFEYVPVVTRVEPRINAESLAAKVKSLQDYDYYLIGHHEFLASMQALLRDSDVNSSQIMTDDFG